MVLWVGSWLAFAAIWLLLDDTTQLGALLTGAVVAGIALVGSELVRRQRIARARVDPRWLRHAWRPVARVPVDLARLTGAALAQAVRPRGRRGRFRSVSFAAGSGRARDNGRHALAEGVGSFSPNTYVVGVDVERREILVHQLVASDGDPRRALDPLELG